MGLVLIIIIINSLIVFKNEQIYKRLEIFKKAPNPIIIINELKKNIRI